MTNNQIVKAQEGLVEVFNFSQEKTPIRVKMVNNEPWFVAKDVCEVLEIANHKDATSRLDNDDRVGGKRSSFSPTFVFRPLTPPYVRFRIRRLLILRAV